VLLLCVCLVKGEALYVRDVGFILSKEFGVLGGGDERFIVV